MIEFTIPDSRMMFPINIKLLTLIKEKPEYFYDDFKITSAYGCPEGCIWNGNRPNPGQYTLAEIRKTLSEYASFGLSYRFTFSNFLLKPEHLYDTYGNAIAREGHNENNWVISSTDLMSNYISEHYPKYKLINSITKFNKTIEEINKESEKNLTVLFMNLNNQFDELKKLTHPENIEVLVNEPCINDCPYKKEHYTNHNKFNLYEIQDIYICKVRDEYDDSIQIKHYVDKNGVLKHHKLGINYFKIAGRDSTDVSVNAYLTHFVKPQFNGIVNLLLLDNSDYVL